MIEIPNGLGREVAEIIQKRKKDAHGQKELENKGNVQILERMAGRCKKPPIALTECGMVKFQQCADQEERDRTGRKCQDPPKTDWETIHRGIDEGMQELGTYNAQDVRIQLNGMRELFTVDIGAALESFYEKPKELGQGMRNAVGDASDRLAGSNNRNNIQEML